MIPAKEAKEMLYKMLSENFVSLQVSAATLSPAGTKEVRFWGWGAMGVEALKISRASPRECRSPAPHKMTEGHGVPHGTAAQPRLCPHAEVGGTCGSVPSRPSSHPPAGDPQDPGPRTVPHLLPLHRERPRGRADAAAPLLQGSVVLLLFHHHTWFSSSSSSITMCGSPLPPPPFMVLLLLLLHHVWFCLGLSFGWGHHPRSLPSPQSVANLMERRQFETKENK